MPEDRLEDDILDLGAASELTLGEPEELQFENVTIEDFWS